MQSTPQHSLFNPQSGMQALRRQPRDWAFAALVGLGVLAALAGYAAEYDAYDAGVLIGAAIGLVALAWQWRSLQVLTLSVAAISLSAIALYQGELARAEQLLALKYLISSQSAILWMSVLFLLATMAYWAAVLARSVFAARSATRMTWAAVALGLSGLLVRWHESYLMGADIGHIPVSNLYEVFVLFCMITALCHLYYEQRYRSGSHSSITTAATETAAADVGADVAADVGAGVGAFVLLVITAAVGFILWYTFERGAHEIQPLVPALQSWWMKIHVPANFIGYGTFSFAAMIGFAWLIKHEAETRSTLALRALWGAALVLALALAVEAFAFRRGGTASVFWPAYFALFIALLAGIVLVRRRVAAQLPDKSVLDDLMYKSIAVGFAFFTIATILGALWAAEAWGTYWQWDPKETWALIVWLNYAAWLHLRLVKGLRGAVLAWWAMVGLLVTTFAFLGVNMFLSGLHSYGEL